METLIIIGGAFKLFISQSACLKGTQAQLGRFMLLCAPEKAKKSCLGRFLFVFTPHNTLLINYFYCGGVPETSSVSEKLMS